MELLKTITDCDILGGTPEYLQTVSRYASRGILVDDMLNVAMMYMSKVNLYKLPGGGLEEGENSQNAFLREIKEETGYEAEIICYLGYIEEHKKRNNFMQYSYCFVAKTKSGKVNADAILSENELELGMNVEWMPIEKALEVMNISLINCNDYSTNFMILRDKFILEQSLKLNIWRGL